MGIATQTSDGLKFSTTYMYVKNSSGTTLAAFKNDGNVGIGIENPTYKLHVSATSTTLARFDGGSANNWVSITSSDTYSAGIVYENAGTGKWYVGHYNGAPGGFSFYDASTSSVKVFIEEGGKVGIGTTDPGYKLDIGGVGSSVDNTIRLNQNNGGTAIRIGAGGGSSDVTLLRVDGESSAGNHDGATDSSEYGFSLRYMGARSGNANSLSIFSDNQNAASQIEAVTIYQNGNVGIGTTDPAQLLHVYGGQIRVNQGTSGVAIGEYSNGAVIWLDGANGDFSGGDYFNIRANNSAELSFGYAGGESVYLTSAGILRVNLSSNLNTGSKIHVNSAIALGDGSSQYTYSQVVGGADLQLISNGNPANLGANSNIIFKLGTSGGGGPNEAMRIVSTGNVGIGTASPSYLLDLQSTATGLTHNLKLNKSSNTGDYAEIAFQLWSGAGTGLNTFGGSGTSRPSVVLRAVNESTSSAAGAFVIGTFTGGSTNSTLTEKFRINSAGNVGIGTNSPDGKLHVHAATAGTVTADSFGDDLIIENSSTVGMSLLCNNGGAGYIYFGDPTDNDIGQVVYDHNSNSLIFVTNAAERMRIQSGGNVGIGTNSPSAKLHIQSDGSHNEGAEIVLRHSNNNSTDVVSTISFQNNAGQVAMIQGGTTGANNTGYISFFTDSAGTQGERMRIQGNGYVGIGTATAYSPLQVYSSTDQKILLSGSANPYIRWQNGGSNRAYIRWLEGNSALTFVNSSGDNFDFLPHDSTGAINLRLKGNDGDIWGSFYAQEGTSPAHEVGILDADQHWALRHINDTSWDFRINNSTYMSINSSGTVAIGGGGTTLLTNEGMILNRSGGAGYVAFYDGSGGAKWNIQRNSGVGNCLRIHAYNNTSQVFKVTKNYNSTDGFNILLDSGSVGIGANSPNKTLEVRYVSTSTDVTAEGLSGGDEGKGLLIYNNNQSNNNVYANLDFRARNADGRIAYQYQSATNVGDFHFITDNTGSPQSMMVIKNDGRVGMGTVSPNARLHVYRPAGTVPGLLLDSNRDGARLNFNYGSSATTFGEIGMTHYGSSGDCQIWMGANLNSNSSSHSGPAVGVAGTGASSWYTVWNTQTAQDFYGIYRRAPSPSSSYENYFRIKSDGNVGINTTNPTDRLHVRSVQSAGNGSGSNLATLSLETYNSNSSSYGSYVKCKNYGGGGGGPDWKIGGIEGYWTTNKVASIDFITGDDWYNPGNKDEGEIGFTVYNNTGSGSTAIEAMRIHQTGNIGIGSTNPGYKLTVNGSFAASSKSFVIDHPTKENKQLIHGSLEGPEHGVYHRGTTQSNTITLPDYWSGLVREDTITVQLTPRGGFQHLYVVSTSLSQIVIGAADGETIDCFYTIYGERADIDSLVVEKDV